MVHGAPGPCSLWTGEVDHQGGGRFHPHGAGSPTHRAHRWAYEQSIGPVPADWYVIAVCRQPACVEPRHHLALSPEDAARRRRKPRLPKVPRERRHAAKLTAELAREVRRMAAERIPQRVIAEAVGVAQPTISAIVTGKAWRGVG